jgi:hypothetical protein
MPRALIDYRTFKELVADYACYCRRGEVWFRDSSGDHAPHDLLHTLRSKELSARIIGFNAQGDQPTRLTVRVSGFFSSRNHEYELIWSPDRQGWGDPPSSGSRTIHYFVPRHSLTDPPYTSEGMLVSLCKRNWMTNDEPFWPTDPKYSRCKTCQKRLDEIGRTKS